MFGLAVDRPFGERNAHHRQGQHRGHDVGEVIDEIDPARLDLLVEGRVVGAHAVTHAHPDHQGASRDVCVGRGVPMWAPEGDADAKLRPGQGAIVRVTLDAAVSVNEAGRLVLLPHALREAV